MKKKIYAMIPARIGSTRLKYKNLALINNKPMIYYAINAAKKSKIFDKIIINSDHNIFKKIAKKYKVDFYQRPKKLGSSKTKSDEVVVDFMTSFPEASTLVWINSVSPFQTSNEIRNTIKFFYKKKLNSLITVENKQVHTFYKNKPINFRYNELFAQTQDMVPVNPFVYSIMMWQRKQFLFEFKKKGYSFFSGKFGVYPVSKLTSLLIKTEEDLLLADMIMKFIKKNKTNKKISYDNLIRHLDN